jgi:tRNA (mo5U34)-methyltransferase
VKTLQSRGPRRARDEIEREIARLAPWFHNLHLPSGHETAADHPLGDFPGYKWEQVATHLPRDLTGWRALDIGCNAGYYAFALAARGARVLGIDVDPHYLAQARWAAEQLGMDGRVEFRRLGIYDLARLDELFELILFMGVLYHLRHPLLALDLVAEKATRLVVVQTLTTEDEHATVVVQRPPRDLDFNRRERLVEPGWPQLAFVERRLAEDPTNWWVPNHACVEAMVRSAGLEVVARPGHEIWLCVPRCLPAVVRDEAAAATGRATGA